jgi:hypothetical protein
MQNVSRDYLYNAQSWCSSHFNNIQYTVTDKGAWAEKEVAVDSLSNMYGMRSGYSLNL